MADGANGSHADIPEIELIIKASSSTQFLVVCACSFGYNVGGGIHDAFFQFHVRVLCNVIQSLWNVGDRLAVI